ncbi:MAG: 30S ribosomal protein S12 methylthiotransferase RimO [Anaeromusa sp.]|uniref:30S ribosomal protein S12 methylthiotransferase RimO n=1 Tax=Anaeromusa sp. TaxID=1872520 RepID=UPI00260E3C34|nr:30S ribosomal protein S12 methylthiotransferase RimO [Anaeromusa sp.]MDD3158898.1 30S ribosomal protein S12 methylthiotransferase RimO [Anaeromusa sp.]MEA4833868.1 30S ribosomal protein S12 methylthiotransferase RimO [Anaeromusa sp.]
MIKAGFVSLGCVKNLVDTEVMLGLLQDGGVELIDDPAEADILVVNTCGFIDAAKEESLQTILQMAEFKKTGRCRGLIVAGCLGQRYQQELLDEMPEVDVILGTAAWGRIQEAVAAALEGRRALFIDSLTTLYDEKTPRISTMPSYSAYVKVAEGCSNCCTYCVIPSVRGAFRSRPIESVVEEVRHLAQKGVREINLVAQDTTSYGKDLYGQPNLVALLKELAVIDGVEWIRLLYCYPRYFTDELIAYMASEPKICRYVDLPLQHIHDGVLQAMNRRDRQADIDLLLQKIRQAMPDVVLRTSFIVGFPGETEEQFAFLEQWLETARFDHVGVFTYSQEEGTAAGAMAEQVPDEVKQERYHRLMALQSKISEEINRSLEGRELQVIVTGLDETRPEVILARSYREAPDVDGQIYVETSGQDGLKVGDSLKVRIAQGFSYDLVAEIVD